MGAEDAAVAGPGRTPRLRVLPSRQALAVCRVGGKDGEGGRQDGSTAHQRRVPGFSPGFAETSPLGEGNSYRVGQSFGPQNQSCAFLQENAKVRFHFTPTYSSWLNQVELWFAKIQRDVIARGVFTSVADLARKPRKYIRAYPKSAKPFRWTYTDPKRRIRTHELAGTTH